VGIIDEYRKIMNEIEALKVPNGAKDMIICDNQFCADDITPDNFEGFVTCRKRPIEIKALQVNLPEGFSVTSTEGVVTGRQGDWLMIGVEGEKYICSNSVFQKTYEVIEEISGEVCEGGPSD